MTTLAARVAREYGSPAVTIDLDVVARNIHRLQDACTEAGLANRPHVKTHKTPAIASIQRAAGCEGITCQKLGEAEVFAKAGYTDILISYNILGADKIARLGALRRTTEVIVSADNEIVVDGLSEAGAIAGRPLGVLVECDTGRGRAGVETPAQAVSLARAIAGRKHLRFDGLLLYAPENRLAETQAFLDATLQGLAEHGLSARIVSTGGTPNLKTLGTIRGATEHRAGTFVFNDRMMLADGVATLEDCALHVVSTVVSRAGETRGILDAGSKTLTSDTGGGLDGYGLIREYPDARIHKLSEEHGFLDLAACAARPAVGEVVSIVPNHVCVDVNMVERLIAVRKDEIIGEMPVAARGKVA